MLPLAHLPKHRSKALFTVSLTIARRSVFFAGASGAFCSGHAPPTAFWGAKERDALGGAAVDIGSAGRVRGLLDKGELRPLWARAPKPKEVTHMLYYALVFFIIAIVAAAFGFGGIAAGAASIAKILFFIFLVVFLVTLVMGLMRR
jgi:uncharacterized membrane protein YtjA (UPF0391 family)